ncbi:MAG: Fic family protein [Proteobacteria bacterium]|nr:Fic family protein [Pseudomonadota bacterium]
MGAANRSIAHYDGILHGVPNPAVLLSPLITQEAVLSSKIEGTQATLGDVLKFEAGETPEQESQRLDIQEIINYRRALRIAEKAIESCPFNLNLLLELHSVLLDSVRGRDKGRGQLRRVQNWIGAPGTPMEQADFVPPVPTLVEEAMGQWEKFYHADQPDPLVQLAIIHAQFEIIHPFLDGNGRLGRMLIPLFLWEKGLLSRPTFYLSAYLEDHRDEYVERLRALGAGTDGWNRWIAFFLLAITKQAKENADKAHSIIELYEAMKTRIIDLTHSQHAVPLLDQIFERPLFQSTDLKLSGDHSLSRQGLTNLLRVLRENGILKVVRMARGRRPQALAFAELINLCEGKQVF